MCAKSFSILLKTTLKTWDNQSNLYADWNRCVFNVCLKDFSVGIVLMFSGNLFQSLNTPGLDYFGALYMHDDWTLAQH